VNNPCGQLPISGALTKPHEWRAAGTLVLERFCAPQQLDRVTTLTSFFRATIVQCNNCCSAAMLASGALKVRQPSERRPRHPPKRVIRSNTMSTQDVVKTYNDLTNQNVERINSLGELNLKVAEKMAARQMDVMNLFMEQGVRMMKLATEAKGYSELYKGQADMAREMTEKLMAESKTNMALAGEIRDDYRGWLDDAMADLKEGNTAVRNAVTA
jgi:hypothetical protein